MPLALARTLKPIKEFLEQIVMIDLGRFTDQYFYTLKHYSFKKKPTKMKIKGMD